MGGTGAEEHRRCRGTGADTDALITAILWREVWAHSYGGKALSPKFSRKHFHLVAHVLLICMGVQALLLQSK